MISKLSFKYFLHGFGHVFLLFWLLFITLSVLFNLNFLKRILYKLLLDEDYKINLSWQKQRLTVKITKIY